MSKKKPIKFSTATISSSAVSLPDWTHLAYSALITVETQSIRYRMDGVDPTDSIGHLAADGDSIVLDDPEQISKFRAIRATAADATIMVSYFGRKQ